MTRPARFLTATWDGGGDTETAFPVPAADMAAARRSCANVTIAQQRPGPDRLPRLPRRQSARPAISPRVPHSRPTGQRRALRILTEVVRVGGFAVHELAEDATQGSEAAGSYGYGTAGFFEGTQTPPRRGSGGPRPNTVPAYYLGRPARVWISVTSPRRKSNAPRPLTDVALEASAAALAHRVGGPA